MKHKANRKNKFQKKNTISEGDELEELDTTWVQESIIAVQKIESPRKKEPTEII